MQNKHGLLRKRKSTELAAIHLVRLKTYNSSTISLLILPFLSKAMVMIHTIMILIIMILIIMIITIILFMDQRQCLNLCKAMVHKATGKDHKVLNHSPSHSQCNLAQLQSLLQQVSLSSNPRQNLLNQVVLLQLSAASLSLQYKYKKLSINRPQATLQLHYQNLILRCGNHILTHLLFSKQDQ